MTSYFELTHGYCWKWSADGQAIELHNGFTVCYTEALTKLLWDMIPPGWPPLGSLLFLLCACKESHTNAALTTWQLKTLVKDAYDSTLPDEVASLLNDSCHLLELVHSLPPELRAARQQAFLLKRLFAGIPPYVGNQQAAEALEHFTPGNYGSADTVTDTIYLDLNWLAKAGRKFKDQKTLLFHLQGNTTPPQPLPATLPLPGDSDLFMQLEGIEQTVGISRLAKHIMAAIYVPMHTYNSGYRQLGGFADLTNKGSYDRLLISELAQDDLLLTARLANSEALYLRREEPPLDRKKKVVMLLDVTLKMWGTPRTFGIAAALASQQQQEKGTVVRTVALGASQTYFMDLHSTTGVISALSLLDGGLHMAHALSTTLEEEKGETEYYLITSEHAASLPEVRAILNTHPPRVDFLLTVDRQGAFNCYHYSGGRKKMVSHAQIALEEVMAGSMQGSSAQAFNIPPNQHPPLRFPITNMKNKPGRHFRREYAGKTGIISITRDGRVEWRSGNAGGLECLRYIESGTYEMLTFPDGSFSILVNAPSEQTLVLYRFVQQQQLFFCKRIVTEAPAGNHDISLTDNVFCLSSLRIDGITGALTPSSVNRTTGVQDDRKKIMEHKSLFRELSKHVFALSEVKKIHVSKDGELMVQGRRLFTQTTTKKEVQLIFSSQGNFSVDREPVSQRPDIIPLPGNPHMELKRFTWADGSQITCDPRGFLFLRSSNKNIPDIVIAAAISSPSAAWANHHFTGNPYFLLHEKDSMLPVDTFYQQYILPFIAHLR